MATDAVAIFPASGGIGGGTYRHLLGLINPKRVILVARSPEKIPEHYKAAGAITRHGDYDKPDTLDHAFDGARHLVLISYASIQHEHRFKVHKYAIDTAIKQGVRHIFYCSLGFAGNTTDSLAHVMLAHLDTENYLAKLATENPSITYTIVRQGIYTESFSLYTAFLDLKNPSDEVKIPHDGSSPGISWVKREELGEGNAHLVANYLKDPNSFSYVNKTLLLSGPREISLQETVDAISKVSGKNIQLRECSVDEWAAQESIGGDSGYLAGGLAKAWATTYDALRRGEGAEVTTHLRDLIGREPESFEKTISDMARA